MHTRKVCFDAVSHNSPVTLYDCHGMKGNQLWRYRKVGAPIVLWNLEPCFKEQIGINSTANIVISDFQYLGTENNLPA